MSLPNAAIIGCGYVGSALGRSLAAGGCDCIGTTTTAAREDEIRMLGVRPVTIQLSEIARLNDLLRDRQVVFLTVAAGRTRRSYRQVYVDGIKHLLQAATGTAVRRVVYTSSTSVYGQDDGGWVDERSPTEPNTENGRVLLEAETCLLDGSQRGGIVTTVLRLSGIYGPGRDPAYRVARQAGQERTDGEVYLNLIHLDDIVTAMTALLDAKHHGFLNLSDDRPTTRREYYDRLIASAGLPPIQWTTGDTRLGCGKRVRNTLIKRTLNLTLKYPRH